MTLNTGICIICDHPGCRASSDDHPSTRGFRFGRINELLDALTALGWRCNRKRTVRECETFCPEHAQPTPPAEG